jgi:hypothetical protein
MARINSIIRFLILHINFFFTVMGICLLGLALYICIADWGNLDATFFIGGGIICGLVGMLLLMLSFLGCFGISYQHRKQGPWTGRRVLGAYEFVLLACFVGAVYGGLYMFAAIATFNSVYDNLDSNTGDDDKVIEFETMEQILAEKFNSFFFGATSGTCADLKYTWFWSFVNDHCDEAISQERCQKCFEYSITMCRADKTECEASADEFGPSCPYNSCRSQLLQYISDKVTPLSYVILSFVLFQVVYLVMTCMMICYTERDSLERQMIKAGTIGDTSRAPIKGMGKDTKTRFEKMKERQSTAPGGKKA